MIDHLLDRNPLLGRQCLIGEADPFMALLLRRYLEKAHLQARQAHTGEFLMRLVQQSPPALIILDPELPGEVRGWELCQALQSGPETNAIPIIVCSWLTLGEVQQLIGQPSVYLQKPELHYKDFNAALKKLGITGFARSLE